MSYIKWQSKAVHPSLLPPPQHVHSGHSSWAMSAGSVHPTLRAAHPNHTADHNCSNMFKQKLKSEKRLIKWFLPQGTSLKLAETIPRWVVCRCNLDWGCLSPPARRQSGITQKEHGEKRKMEAVNAALIKWPSFPSTSSPLFENVPCFLSSLCKENINSRRYCICSNGHTYPLKIV